MMTETGAFSTVATAHRFGAALLLAALAVPAPAQPRYWSLGVDVVPDDISDDGSVVCGTSHATGPTASPFVFTWSAATGYTQIGNGLVLHVQAYLSGDGTRIARNYNSYGTYFGEQAHLWDGGARQWQSLGWLSAPGQCATSEARGISADGRVVVGDSYDSCRLRAFRWDSATGMVDLGLFGRAASASCVSGDGAIVGGWDAEPVRGKRLAAVWYPDSRGEVLFLPGTLHNPEGAGEITHINRDGSMIAGRSDDNNGPKFFRWTAARGVEILDRGEPRAVSEDGRTIVGIHRDASGGSVPFIWREDEGKQPLEQYLLDQGVPVPAGEPISRVHAMTPDGRFIIGERGIAPPREGFVVQLPDGIRYGVGAAAANTLSLDGAGSAGIGETFVLTTSNVTGPSATTLITTGPSTPLPFLGGAFLIDLGGPLLFGTTPAAGGSSGLPLPIPNHPGLVGSRLYMQTFAADTVQPGGLAFSNGLWIAMHD